MKKIDWWTLLAMIVIAETAGMIGGLLGGNMASMYQELTKPPIAPPGWLFGVVWPILYLLMGIASYLIIKSEPSNKKDRAMRLYWAQLLINMLWPIVFSRFELYWLAVIVIIVLDILVFLTIIAFSRINKVAGYLLIPYLAWIIFATYLNIGIALMN